MQGEAIADMLFVFCFEITYSILIKRFDSKLDYRFLKTHIANFDRLPWHDVVLARCCLLWWPQLLAAANTLSTPGKIGVGLFF